MGHGSGNTEPMDSRKRHRRARFNDYGAVMTGGPVGSLAAAEAADVWDRYATDWREPVTLADSIDRAHRAAAAGHAARGETLPAYLVTYGADVDAMRAETRAARLARCDAADAADTDRS